ncbi:MAG TPA: HEAT repeat domain-containing protein [Acidimicrobiales bacterium]
MGKYAYVEERTGFGLPRDGRTRREDIPRLLDLTADDDPKVRAVAAKNLCPCHVKGDLPEVWERLYEMLHDPDARVRRDAVHALADGSPRERADEIAAALYQLRNDPERGIRRNVARVLREYRRTGRVNVL